MVNNVQQCHLVDIEICRERVTKQCQKVPKKDCSTVVEKQRKLVEIKHCSEDARSSQKTCVPVKQWLEVPVKRQVS